MRWSLPRTLLWLPLALAACAGPAPVTTPDAGVAPSDAGLATPDAGPADSGPPAPTDEQVVGVPWVPLAEAPHINGKQDDLHFVTPELGWSVNGLGNIHRTTDGGQTWTHLLEQAGTYFRAVLFTSATRGFVANIGPGYFPGVTDPNPLYETRDGGETWTVVTSITGPMPAGICNFTMIDAQHLVAVGRVGGPSFVLLSSDGGETWTSTDVTAQLAMLIDARFTSPQQGWLLGGSSANLDAAHTVVLHTEDGGASWQEVFRSELTREIGWKLSFPTADVGYASVLSYNDTSSFLKTTDGGRTWQQRPLGVGAYEAKGIGFINARVGWVGGERVGKPVYRTSDGGDSWVAVSDLGPLVNRFRFVDPWTGYAIGSLIYKLEIPRP